MSEDDLSALLPDAPPPRPARREAAIEAALRRFDGLPDAAEQRGGSVQPIGQPARRRPQFAMLTTAAILAAIGVPLAVLTMRDPPPVASAPPAAPKASVEVPAAGCRSAECGNAVSSPRAAELRRANADRARSTEVHGRSATALSRAPAEVASRTQEARPLPQLAPAPSPFSAIAPSAAAPPAPPPPPPPPPAPSSQVAQAEATANRTAGVSEDATYSSSAEVVVTGSRRRNSRAASRGVWNACTAEDPRRDLRACRAGGALGRNLSAEAAQAMQEGLSLHWNGQNKAALEQLGRAIELAPRSAAPLLNRALIRQQEGELQGALADLDRADRAQRGNARILYHRSRVLRQLGQERRARQDEQRAADLDPRYDELVD